ncbi:spore coat protein U-like protein [Variovorax paradoxus]|uniref:Csu type fimbrial protein n=1 Tax=Variovorax paradoxus TaxID=34073 RepID=UPI003393222A
MKRAARRLCTLGVCLGLYVGAGPSNAAQCTVSTTGLAFGAYAPFSTAPNNSNGSVQITCDAVASYSIALATGGSGSFDRAMASGTYRLKYNVFTEPSRTIVWGDGTGGSSSVTGSGTAATIPLFGRIPARQNVGVGSYTDTLIVTVSY